MSQNGHLQPCSTQFFWILSKDFGFCVKTSFSLEELKAKNVQQYLDKFNVFCKIRAISAVLKFIKLSEPVIP